MHPFTSWSSGQSLDSTWAHLSLFTEIADKVHYAVTILKGIKTISSHGMSWPGRNNKMSKYNFMVTGCDVWRSDEPCGIEEILDKFPCYKRFLSSGEETRNTIPCNKRHFPSELTMDIGYCWLTRYGTNFKHLTLQAAYTCLSLNMMRWQRQWMDFVVTCSFE